MPTLSHLQKPTRGYARLVTHPLLAEHISYLRDKETKVRHFRRHLKEASKILFLELLKKAPTKKIDLETPLTKTQGEILSHGFVLVGILRAGLGMIEGILEMFPKALVGHIGIFRNEETLEPIHYYTKIPKIPNNAWVILLDPMLATGGSAVEAIGILKKYGATKIKMVSIISAKKGIEVLRKHHPNVELLTAAIDPVLNNKGYIVPGLGDCGDRLFGT